MATVFEFTVASEGVFPNQAVDIPSFIEEIQSSAITATLVSVKLVAGNCRVEFATDLTDNETVILGQLVQAHQAVPSGERIVLPFIWQAKNMAASQAEAGMNVMGLSNLIDGYAMTRGATVCGVNIRLKTALTAGSLTVVLSKNGAATTYSKVITPEKGKKTLWLISPGKVVLEKGDELGIRYSTDAAFLPLTNEIDITLEIKWTQS